jgi:hypothetical protein
MNDSDRVEIRPENFMITVNGNKVDVYCQIVRSVNYINVDIENDEESERISIK